MPLNSLLNIVHRLFLDQKGSAIDNPPRSLVDTSEREVMDSEECSLDIVSVASFDIAPRVNRGRCDSFESSDLGSEYSGDAAMCFGRKFYPIDDSEDSFDSCDSSFVDSLPMMRGEQLRGYMLECEMEDIRADEMVDHEASDDEDLQQKEVPPVSRYAKLLWRAALVSLERYREGESAEQ